MVGRTGHGKSRLGSFLVSPDNTETLDNVAFEFSEMPTSCTTNVATHPLTTWGSDGDRFEIIDTPGLGESPPRDFLHTVNLVRHLQNNPRLAGIVLCWR